MAPERTGGIPLILWTKLCFSGKYTESQVEKLISGRGGLGLLSGSNRLQRSGDMIEEGSKKAALVYEAMAYQVAKAIAVMSVALKGSVDAVILTGGAAHSELLTGMIEDYAGHIGKFVIMPGENELEALGLRRRQDIERPRRRKDILNETFICKRMYERKRIQNSSAMYGLP